jgi:hypothetical protein
MTTSKPYRKFSAITNRLSYAAPLPPHLSVRLWLALILPILAGSCTVLLAAQTPPDLSSPTSPTEWPGPICGSPYRRRSANRVRCCAAPLGGASQGPRLTHESWSPDGNTWTIQFEGARSAGYDFGIFGAQEIQSIEWGELLCEEDGIAHLHVTLLDHNSAHTTLILHLNGRKRLLCHHSSAVPPRSC